MSALRGALADHRNYLRYIALPNAVAYFDFLEESKERPNRGAPTMEEQFERLRLFLNAVESMSNVPEYYFHDSTREVTLKQFIEHVRRNHPCLGALAEIANAYKHCVRGRDDSGSFQRNVRSRHAADLAPVTTTVATRYDESSSAVAIDLRFEVPGVQDADHEVLCEAFRFWIAYENEDATLDFSKPT